MRLFTTIAGLRCYLEAQRPLRAAALGGSSLPDAKHHLTQSQSGQIVDSNHPSNRSSNHPPMVGLVPTMGALHAGHLSLIRRARQENDRVVVSIFVNPLQFGPNEDFQRYPRTLEQDERLCQEAGVDAIFAPSATELYGTPFAPIATDVTQVIPPAAMMAGLCGAARPGHFQGVATVVTKLLNVVQPDRAYFGQKDAQQVAIIRRLVADLNVPVEIVTCPIVREADGLALSSRNRYLSPEERSQATALYRGLQQAEQIFEAGRQFREDLIRAVKEQFSTVPLVQPEYIELVDPDTMNPLEQVEDTALLAVAARIGSTRLIDNVLLRNRQPIVAIDGPAGAGKSTVARQVAQQLGLLYLDTGAMYRAVTWKVLQSGIAIDDEPAIAELVSQSDIQLEQAVPQDSGSSPYALRVWIDGEEVTQAIRTLAVTEQVSAIAALSTVRRELVKRQQAYGRRGGIVMDGRDIGTYVFPDAELKIFLTASVQERARRRLEDLKRQNQPLVSLPELEAAIAERDRKDSTRQLAPLRKAADAIEINSDDLTVADVTARIVSLYQENCLRYPEAVS
ncbi:bifunctional pantoate--beta-alanine ligase/(d)CMP kinase [Leptolyngbya ohadii]|uniref:bifunctional pantoate--beta-alanine ligase/(d)CMP kinase n=1 Tax=Leptolyngbya ohadii TaxID=1962290 RepID=UPI000B59F5E5|nr:bifunctional pantoate--beta-alanine ligase/(d)CMP kinase [Leptolyngbya ohadii]